MSDASSVGVVGKADADISPVTALQERHGSHRSEGILAHPRFPAARALYIRQILGLYEHEPYMNRLLIEAGRHVMFGLIACSHAQYDEADRETWLTVKRFKEQVAMFGLVSSRSVDDILVRLVETGFIALRPAPRDRRLRLIEPTEKLDAHNFDVIAAHIRPLQAMFTETRYAAFLSKDKAFLQAQRMSAVATFGLWALFITGNAEMMHFLPRPSGIQILFKLVELGLDGSDREPSLAEIGLRFGVSRSHVRNLVIEAEQAGLLERIGGGEASIRLTPRCAAAFDRFVADALASSDLTGCMADARLRETAPRDVARDILTAAAAS